MAYRAQQHTSQIVLVLKDPIFVKQMAWVALLGVVMTVTILMNVDFLNTKYPDPVLPQPPDLILDSIPPNYTFITIGEYLSRLEAAFMAFFFLSSTARLRRLPRLFFMLAIMYILRGFAFTLTPLKQIVSPEEYYSASNFFAQKFYHGMYFSGHSASALIQAFFFWDERYRGTRITWFVLPVALAEIVSLLISHQHYSVDIFGAVFVAYFALTFNFMNLVPKPLLQHRWMPWRNENPGASPTPGQ